MTGLFVKLDVEYASDDKMIEAGPMAELLYVRSLAFCKKNSSNDGKVSSAQLAVVAVGIPAPKRHAARLVEVGAWTKSESGWEVAAWLKRNRSGADIQAQQEMASTLGIQGNHERWHTGPDGKPSPKCPICIGLHRQTRSPTPSGTPTETGRVSDRKVSPETETETETEEETEEETETEPKQRSSSSANNPQPAVENPDDDEIEHRYATDPPIVTAAANLIAEHLANRNANGNRHGYIRAVLNDRPRIDAIRTIHEHDIELTAEQIAAKHLGTDNEPASEPREPWYADPHCTNCPGDGMVSIENGYVTWCPCRRTEPYIATVTPIRGTHT